SQQITLSMRDIPVEEVFQSIEKQSSYVFFYDSKELGTELISVQINNMPIRKALEECFRNLPLVYKIVGKNIVVSRDPHWYDRNAIPQLLKVQTDSLKGNVTDGEGIPLPGVTVQVKGTSHGTFTAEDGQYMLVNVPE